MHACCVVVVVVLIAHCCVVYALRLGGDVSAHAVREAVRASALSGTPNPYLLYDTFDPYHIYDNSTESNCGETKCTNDENCPSFSPFYDALCNTSNLCYYEPVFSNKMCNTTEQCASGDCYCDASLSLGCSCDYYGASGDCDGMCLEGTCQPAWGYIGEPCDNNFVCQMGVCTPNGICEWMQEGQPCSSNYECLQPGLYCADLLICEPLPPCSEELLFNGSCPAGQQCFNGTCITFYQLNEGEECNADAPECKLGLACLNGTCQNVPLGTPCNQTLDCEQQTQDCLCVQASDSDSKQCVDSGYYLCEKILQAAWECYNNYCLYYDMYVEGTPCYNACNSVENELNCCIVCNYPQYYDNAISNYVGNCADNSIKPVNCCNTTSPCTILPVADMCAGYN